MWLTGQALENSNIQKILEQLDEIEYTKEELGKTYDIFCAVQDRIADTEEAKKYLEGIKKDSQTIKREIHVLIDKLVNRKRDVSNASASDTEVKKDCMTMLKGYKPKTFVIISHKCFFKVCLG